MARAGRRYPLVIYTRMLDRWWPAIFVLGLAVGALAWPFYADLYTRLTAPWRWMTLTGVGGLLILVALLMLLFRKSAYVQPFSDHLRLVTPFLRLNISYRRIQRTSSVSMGTLFPPRKQSGLRRDVVEPLWNMTAILIELTSLPLPASTLRLFLSPFFFKDKTPHLVILVSDWMRFSTELESLRVAGDAPPAARAHPSSSILSKLPHR